MSEEEAAQNSGSDRAEEMPELTEAEREALEQQMREVRVEDLLAQTVASVLNLSARRILKEDEIDLDQARLGIDAVRALVELLPAEVGVAVREPLSQIQMLYAQRSGSAPVDPGQGHGEGPAGSGGEPGEGRPPTDQSGDSGLWIPGR